VTWISEANSKTVLIDLMNSDPELAKEWCELLDRLSSESREADLDRLFDWLTTHWSTIDEPVGRARDDLHSARPAARPVTYNEALVYWSEVVHVTSPR
jgi:hypothetical protein